MIYLDYNATTPVAPEVARAIDLHLGEEFGNPGSDYALGRRAQAAVEQARREAAGLLGCAPDEVVFTSGATEANNLALKGVAWHFGRGRILSSAVEHPAVRQPLAFLAAEGFDVTMLPVDGDGLVDPEAVRRALTPDTILISVMHANNETGAIQPIAEIGAVAREAGVLLHTDAAQSVGKIPVNVDDLKVDYLTLAGHKMYAPKGVGALYVRRGSPLAPLLHGASQEGGRRAGTENVPYLAGLGEACRLGREGLSDFMTRVAALRDLLHRRLREGFPQLILNGPPDARLPNTLNVSFPGFSGRRILAALPELAASLGAACHGDLEEPSPVLTAMGLPRDLALSAVRLSLGRPISREEVERAAELLLGALQRLTG